MRISFAMSYDKGTHNISQKMEELDQLTSTVDSGKRLNTPGDDPLAWAQAMDVKQNLREMDAFQKNIDFATQWGEATDNALGQFNDILSQTKDIVAQANSAQYPANKDALVQMLGQLSTEALDIANAQNGQQYLFSGRATSTAPFQANDPNFTYQGDTQIFDVRVGKNLRATINLDGQTVFQTDPTDPNTNILKTIQDLTAAVQAEDKPGIQTASTALYAAQEHILAQRSMVGSRLQNLSNRKDALESVQADRTKGLSTLEDADAVATISQLQQTTTAFQAALKATSMLNGLNLTQYL